MSTVFNFFTDSTYNSDTKHQLWLSTINDIHDTFCCCTRPFAHLLAQLFPEDHKDRHLTVHQIVTREFKAHKCLFGGKQEEDGGVADAGPSTDEGFKLKLEESQEEGFADLNIEELIAAAETRQEER